MARSSGAIALMAVALLVTSRFLHISIAGVGQGPLFPILAIPATSVALVAWAVATARLSRRLRRASLIATILVASAAWTMLRVGGITGDGRVEPHWRWTPNPEDRVVELAVKPGTPPAAPTKSEAPAPASAPTAPVDRPAIDGRVLKIRKASTPDELHREIYRVLQVPPEVMTPVKTWTASR